MSSPGSDETRNESGEAPMWHPAREWLEEDEGDEDDLDYAVPSTIMETEDDWEDDDDVEDERMGLGISDGETGMLGLVTFVRAEMLIEDKFTRKSPYHHRQYPIRTDARRSRRGGGSWGRRTPAQYVQSQQMEYRVMVACTLVILPLTCFQFRPPNYSSYSRPVVYSISSAQTAGQPISSEMTEMTKVTTNSMPHFFAGRGPEEQAAQTISRKSPVMRGRN